MQKVTMTKYIDSEGKQIAYGDILRLKNYQPSDKPYAPKEPYYMVVNMTKLRIWFFVHQWMNLLKFQNSNLIIMMSG